MSIISADEWLDSRRSLATRTREAYRGTLKRVVAALAELTGRQLPEGIHDLTPGDLWDFLDHLTERGDSSRYRKTTWCILQQWLSVNEVEAVNHVEPNFPFEEPVREWHTTSDALECWNAACHLGPQHRVLLTATLWGLMRRSEVIRLRISDLHFDTKQIRIRGKNTRGGRGGGGGGEKVRTIAMSDHLAAELQDYLVWRERAILEWGRLKRATLDPRYRDRVLLVPYRGSIHSPSERTLDDWAVAIHRLALDRVGHHHVFRRTGARILWEKGVPAEVIARILGHSDVNQTLEYIGVNLDHEADALIDFDPLSVGDILNEVSQT